jgi:hypothetical protein
MFSMIQRVLRKLDRVFLGGAVMRNALHSREARQAAVVSGKLDYRFVVQHQKDRNSVLSQLCDRYGSDKGEIDSKGQPYPWPSHTYADFYERLFGHCRAHIHHVFECGLGTNNPDFQSSMGVLGKPGASLRVWRDYFPDAQVVGADIDRGVLFEESRIRTFYVDQTQPSAIAALWQQVGNQEFDLMVDDGLHTFEAGVCLFENSVARLAPHGIYVIEDVSLPDLALFQTHFATQPYKVDYVNLVRPDLPLTDNSLVVIRKN